MTHVTLTTATKEGQPISSVLVRIYDRAGAKELGYAITNTAGQVSFDLPPDIYSVRFAKRRTAFKSQYFFALQSTDTQAGFSFEGHPLAAPTAYDPRLCAVHGELLRSDGTALRNAILRCFPKFTMEPSLRQIISPQVTSVRADQDGYVVVNLLRKHTYLCRIEDHYDWHFDNVIVPDQPSAELVEILFPSVSSVLLDPPAPFTILQGSELLTRPQVRMSNGTLLRAEFLEWFPEEPSIASVRYDGEFLRIKGLQPGTTQINARPLKQDTQPNPLPDVAGLPFDVSVLQN